MKMAKKSITIHDIAKKLNITASTVSRALNDHPLISDQTKKRVKDLAKKLNYQPNTVAANLRKGKANEHDQKEGWACASIDVGRMKAFRLLSF